MKKKKSIHECPVCHKTFLTGPILGGHVIGHRIAFEDLKGDGSKKKRLLEENGHRCQICGLSEWQGQPIPLELDHVDGNSDNGVRENLRVICLNCHAQTPTFRGKNVGRHEPTIRSKYFKHRRSE